MYDPYSVLGVSRQANDDEIKQAFRGLAKRFHPDTPEGSADKGRRFTDLSIAYEIIGNHAKRRSYDRGEIDAHGNPRANYTPRPEAAAEADTLDPGDVTTAERPTSKNGEANGFRGTFEKAFGVGPATEKKSRVEELFGEFFGERSAGRKRPAPGKGLDTHYDLHITFEEAALGGTRRVKLPSGNRFDVKIPVGVKEGQTIRLRALGEPGLPGGPAGDALITIAIEPHPYFRRDGRDIHLALPITLNEALHGGKVKVPTLQGPVTMAVPQGANAGQSFRLKGKGIPGTGLQASGDQLVTLQIVLPDQSDPHLSDIVKRWETAHPYQPRRKFGDV
ncbi:MAG: DnaJ C-terminal domain-containing protein [Micropepsaceae bacterium]